ncbi:uncharacterized protein MELLADRAFT_116204 [Melampsora larici-populina 98AG31]|uniref:Uncharacterized protein n=1 Tax=Melampsora larici-populina (strain 98AG31 / pathotype 3-4-7) TaxID=747676 RepID=F4RIU4_MELLP|nr:uncharacterized protein MELLADRAFT_116204 [Melampsora larici-populina 98AG31]EGG07773.1 hypothetical protein MELLADRAFT_116204 [Melampsora larici-populina 98AG31]
MTISNGLDSNISLLSRISSDGPRQSNQIKLLLTSTSQSCLVRVNHSVPLREFIETFLSYHPATQFPPVKHHTSKHDSLYLEDVEVAADWFKMNIDHYPQNVDKKLESEHLSIVMTFIVTIMLPIELIELRLILLKSSIFERFDRSMQILLKLQIVSSYISIGELPNAKIFLNKMVSRSNKSSNIPEFKTLQDCLSNVKLELPVSEFPPESNSRQITSSPGIIDSFVDEVHDVKIEEDEIDTKPSSDQIHTPAQSSKNRYGTPDDKPSLNTISNSFASQGPIVISDDDDTKPDLNLIQGPRRSSRKRHVTSNDVKPSIDTISQRSKQSSRKRRGTLDDEDASVNTASHSLSNQNEVMEIDDDLSDSKPFKKQTKRSNQSTKKRRVTPDDEDALINTTSNSLSNQNEVMEIDEDLSDSKPLKKQKKRPKQSSKKRRVTSENDEALINTTSNGLSGQNDVMMIDEDTIDSKPRKKQIQRAKERILMKKRHSSNNNNRPKLNDIISRMSELMEELQKSKGVSKDECKEMLKTLDDRRYKIRAARVTKKNTEVKDSDFYMGTYRVYREWCAEHRFSELPITFDKVFLWAELSLRSYAVHDLKMERRIRELDWFRGQTISMGSDKRSFWPDSFWIKYFDDERFPHFFLTKCDFPRRTAYPRDNLELNNSYPAPMPPQRQRPQASSPRPSTSQSPQRRLKSESRSVSCELIPDVVILDDQHSPEPIDSKITLESDRESRQDMEEAKYLISADTVPEPINKIDYESLRKPKHISKQRSAIIKQLQWESQGVIVKHELFANAFWKYKIDGITPLEKFGKREESRRVLNLYLEYCERNQIMALPFTNIKINLFFIQDLHHLASSTTRNYLRYLCHTIEIIKIIIPHLAGDSIDIDEIRGSKLWKRWLAEREEYDQSKKSGNHPSQ